MTQGENDRAREMTYQVGWKRGKIKMTAKASGGRLLDRLWQPLPALPLKALAVLLVLLPVAGFALLLVLAGMLARVKN